MTFWSNKYETIHSAQDIATGKVQGYSEQVVKHANKLVRDNRGEYEFALQYTDEGAYKGKTLWVIDNSSVTYGDEN